MIKASSRYVHVLWLQVFIDWSLYEYLENNDYNMVLIWVYLTF